jgi:hypothetical protein
MTRERTIQEAMTVCGTVQVRKMSMLTLKESRMSSLLAGKLDIWMKNIVKCVHPYADA